MKLLAIFAAVFVASSAAGDVIFERTFRIFAGSLLSVQDDNRFSKNIEFQWVIIDPVGSVSVGDRIPFLSFPIDRLTDIGSSAEVDSGLGFDIAVSRFADERVETAHFFSALRTNFFFESNEPAGMVDLTYPEWLFLGVPFGTKVSPLAGADIDAFRVTLLDRDISVSDDATTTRVTANYEIQLQIIGTIPSPSGAAVFTLSTTLFMRRNRCKGG